MKKPIKMKLSRGSLLLEDDEVLPLEEKRMFAPRISKKIIVQDIKLSKKSISNAVNNEENEFIRRCFE